MPHAAAPHAAMTPEVMKRIVQIVDDRRKHARHAALLPVHLSGLGADGGAVSFTAATLDLSFSGIRIHSTRPVPVGSRVTVTVRFPEHKIEVDAHCKVVWQRDATNGGHEVGLKIQWKVPKGKAGSSSI